MPSLVGSPNDSDTCPLSSYCESYTSSAIHTGDRDLSLLSYTDIDDESTGHESTRPKLTTQESPGASGSSQERITLASFVRRLSKNSVMKRVAKGEGGLGVGGPPLELSRMSRADKIFKENYFLKSEWTRVFLFGPMNPREDPHCFYCQICQRNVSIYEQGAAEIKRHYSREHFAKTKNGGILT